MSKPEIVVVTGASAGLGRAIVRAFAQEGVHVGLIARGREGLEGAHREVEELGGKAVVYRADVADATQVEAAAAVIEEQLGPIDIWVNNAMTSVFSPIKEMTEAEFKAISQNEYPDSGCSEGVNENVPFREKRIPLQAFFHCLHRGFAQLHSLCVHLATQCDHGLEPFPGHTFGPL
jgi:hypothetical protein